MELSIEDIRRIRARRQSGLLTLKKTSGARMIAPVRDGEIPGSWSDGVFYVDLVRPSTVRQVREFLADDVTEWSTNIGEYDYRTCPQVKILRPPYSPSTADKLTDIEGVGRLTAQRLFASVDFESLKEASKEKVLAELTAVSGVSDRIANRINDFFLKAYEVPESEVVAEVEHETKVEEKSLRDLVGEALAEAGDAVGWEDILENVPSEMSFSKRSVSAYLSSESYSLRIGRNEYVHRSSLPIEDPDEMVEFVEEHLLQQGKTTSTVKLIERLSNYDDRSSDSFGERWEEFTLLDDAPKYLWGLLNERETVQTGPHFLVSLKGDDSTELLDDAILDALKRIGPAAGMETDAEIDREFGFDYPDERVIRRLRKLHKEKKIGRLGDRHYYPIANVEEAEIISILESEPIRLLGVELDDSNLEKFRNDELWYLAKAFRRTGNGLQARRVTDNLEARGAPQTERDDWLAVRDPGRAEQNDSVPDEIVETLLGDYT